MPLTVWYTGKGGRQGHHAAISCGPWPQAIPDTAHNYYVDLSQKLWDVRAELLNEH